MEQLVEWIWNSWWNENCQGKWKYSVITCLSAPLSTTSPTWPELGLEPVRCGGKSVTNCLSCGTGVCRVRSVICGERVSKKNNQVPSSPAHVGNNRVLFSSVFIVNLILRWRYCLNVSRNSVFLYWVSVPASGITTTMFFSMFSTCLVWDDTPWLCHMSGHKISHCSRSMWMRGSVRIGLLSFLQNDVLGAIMPS
jgi:hypothetical protein